MLKQFKEFIEQEGLFGSQNHILVAVSGGVDSMVMLDLLIKGKYPASIAHCNFKLRGKDSDLDEEFVRDFAKMHGMPFFCKSFDTSRYARKKGISIQMAARELRYKWFEELRAQEGCDHIATGHNMNDNAETFFVNLLRGTGLAGLTGISAKTGYLVRPLLSFLREDIEVYAARNEIAYRTDRSNNETKYLRNYIRHHIITQFVSQRQDFISSLHGTMQKLDEVHSVYLEYIDILKRKILEHSHGRTLVRISSLKVLEHPHVVLYEILRPFGFNEGMINDILDAMNGTPGKQFFTSTHKLTIDREFLMLEDIIPQDEKQYIIPRCKKELTEPLNIMFRLVKAVESEISGDPALAFLDFEKIEFPLKLRKWQHGDVFYPLGMKRPKKLSDFFIDSKVPLPDKDNIWLLCSGEDIIWVVGYRIDERFKVSESTQKILLVEWKKDY